MKPDNQGKADLPYEISSPETAPGLTRNEHEALERLLEIARRGTGQSAGVTNFLLAWWNAKECGGFDLTDLWSLDKAITDDILIIFGFIARRSMYPDSILSEGGEPLTFSKEFEALVHQWRMPERSGEEIL